MSFWNVHQTFFKLRCNIYINIEILFLSSNLSSVKLVGYTVSRRWCIINGEAVRSFWNLPWWILHCPEDEIYLFVLLRCGWLHLLGSCPEEKLLVLTASRTQRPPCKHTNPALKCWHEKWQIIRKLQGTSIFVIVYHVSGMQMYRKLLNVSQCIIVVVYTLIVF